MASNNKRVATKHIRDGIKAKYKKESCCSICGTEDSLELHHYSTVSLLLKDYANTHGIPIGTDDEVLAMRDKFYEIYSKELIEDTVTLCAKHHALLHKTYGKAPPLHTAKKQAAWVLKRRDALEYDVNDLDKKDIKELTTSCNSLTAYKLLRIPLSEFKV